MDPLIPEDEKLSHPNIRHISIFKGLLGSMKLCAYVYYEDNIKQLNSMVSLFYH